jgi:hypothetical protein
MILIAGTEVVYLDGDRLKRGEGNDYMMDYNSGEITFTAKHLITRFSRIVVEFQYSDRNYARSVLAFNDQVTWKKWTFTLNVFSEQDHKNQPFQARFN